MIRTMLTSPLYTPLTFPKKNNQKSIGIKTADRKMLAVKGGIGKGSFRQYFSTALETALCHIFVFSYFIFRLVNGLFFVSCFCLERVLAVSGNLITPETYSFTGTFPPVTGCAVDLGYPVHHLVPLLSIHPAHHLVPLLSVLSRCLFWSLGKTGCS